MYKTTDPKYEILYAATTFLSPLQSNDLSEAEKKLAREYLKEETKKLETLQAAEETEDAQEAEEKQEESVYIPGAGRLGRLNNRDLRRLNKEGEFDIRSVFLAFRVQHILFDCSTDLQLTLIASRRTPSML